MWKVLIFFVYLIIEALIVVSFENSHEYVRSAQIFGIGNREDNVSYRLPNTTIPKMYSINLVFSDFDRDDMSFLGSVNIEINVLENTNEIILHSSVLVLNTFLTKSDENGIAVEHTRDIDVEREFLLIRTTKEILQRSSILWLSIDFIGFISTLEEGVFRKSFLNLNGAVSHYVATISKPNNARKIFPSYDEPRFKAQFIISLNHSAQYKAISNVKEKDLSEDQFGHRVTVFNYNHYMPTYLIAFAIFDFEAREYRTTNNISLRIFSNSIENQNKLFGLKMTEQILHMFEDEFSFEIQYKLDKLDQVALPFLNRCGIANYGIAFYRENCLLLDSTVCHQILDNRLTLAWWSSQWLSEGLCRFYEYYMTAKIYPTMSLHGLFTVEILEDALLFDSSLSTHSLSHYVESPSAVRELHDSITYNKSASIFRMFFYSLSETIFTKGLKIFLNESSLNPMSITFKQHLYDAWQRAANENNSSFGDNNKMEELFDCWEHQVGYPLLFVERSYNNRRVRFTQKRFILSTSTSDIEKPLWHIPIAYSTQFSRTTSPKPSFWMPKNKTFEIVIDDLLPNSYLLINVDRIGYYRVQYDEANWMLISKELSHMDLSSNISPISRAMLINDAGIFLTNNLLRARIFLELMKHLEHDIEYITWYAATKNLYYMRLMILSGNSKISDDFKRFLKRLLLKVYTTYGIEEKPNEPDYHKHIRNIAIEWSCGVHLQECLDATREKLWKFILDQQNETISVDHENVIFCKGLIMITEHEFDIMWEIFKRTPDPKLRNLYLNSLGCIEDESLLTKFIMMIIESKEIDNVVNNEWQIILKATYSNNAVGLRVALQFLRQHYDAFIGLLLELNAIKTMNEILRDIAKRVNDNSLSATISDLLSIYSIDTSIQHEIHVIVESNLQWLRNHSSDIQDFLDDFHNNTALTTACTVIWYLVIMFLVFIINWIIY